MTTTKERKDEPMTFEQIREMFQEMSREADRRSQEADRRSQEADRRSQETDREIKEASRERKEAQAETDRQMQETDRRLQETDRQIKETDRQIKAVSRQLGGMANSDGDAAEEFFATSLASKMMFAGQHYDAIDFNVKRKVKDLKGEYDIVLYNGTTVAIIEVKNKACQADVEELVAKKLPVFRSLFPLYRDHAVYLGIGSMSFDNRVLKKAHELGIGILRQKGDTIEADTGHVRAYT
jgi:hypothetical protein